MDRAAGGGAAGGGDEISEVISDLDVFVVKYDATSPDGQTELPVHRDNGLLSFSLTLGLTLTLTLGPSLTLSLPLTLALALNPSPNSSPHPHEAAYHKPLGVVSSMKDDQGRPDLSSVLPMEWQGTLHPVGRLAT